VTGAIEPFDNAGEPMRHDPHARLRERLSITNPTLFDNPEVRELYVDYYNALCNELETVSGYGVAMMALAERYAFCIAQMKAYDMQDEPLDGLHYEKLLARFAQTFDRLLKGRDERTADELFKRQFMTALIAAVADAIETTVADRGEALRIQAAIASRLRRAQTEPAASRGA
jgi:hypothetical protein